MNTIQKAMDRKNQYLEKNIALTWHNGHYTEEQAKLSAAIQGLSWANVTVECSRLYEIDARAGRESWN